MTAHNSHSHFIAAFMCGLTELLFKVKEEGFFFLIKHCICFQATSNTEKKTCTHTCIYEMGAKRRQSCMRSSMHGRERKGCSTGTECSPLALISSAEFEKLPNNYRKHWFITEVERTAKAVSMYTCPCMWRIKSTESDLLQGCSKLLCCQRCPKEKSKDMVSA